MTLQKRGASTMDGGDTDRESPQARKRLRVWIPTTTDINNDISPGDDPSALSSTSTLDSLFDDVTTDESLDNEETVPASLTAPSDIEGLYFDPNLLLSESLATSVVDFCQRTYFQKPGVNQVMLFGRFDSSSSSTSPMDRSTTGFPPILRSLLDALDQLLRPLLPDPTYDLLFPSHPDQSRQAIINLYHPGEGITPHVDLLGRYGDGIIGVSFGSGCTMRFDEVAPLPQSPIPSSKGTRRRDLYLPERSMVILSKDARYKWTHGIEKRTGDWVRSSERDTCRSSIGEWRERQIRLSVTFRWMLEGADVVGDP